MIIVNFHFESTSTVITTNQTTTTRNYMQNKINKSRHLHFECTRQVTEQEVVFWLAVRKDRKRGKWRTERKDILNIFFWCCFEQQVTHDTTLMIMPTDCTWFSFENDLFPNRQVFLMSYVSFKILWIKYCLPRLLSCVMSSANLDRLTKRNFHYKSYSLKAVEGP